MSTRRNPTGEKVTRFDRGSGDKFHRGRELEDPAFRGVSRGGLTATEAYQKIRRESNAVPHKTEPKTSRGNPRDGDKSKAYRMS